MREWKNHEIRTLIKSEALALEGAKEINMLKLGLSGELTDELKANPDLFVVAYSKEGGWHPIGTMTYLDYDELMVKNPSGYACHPVNFESLDEFDALAIKFYPGT